MRLCSTTDGHIFFCGIRKSDLFPWIPRTEPSPFSCLSHRGNYLACERPNVPHPPPLTALKTTQHEDSFLKQRGLCQDKNAGVGGGQKKGIRGCDPVHKGLIPFANRFRPLVWFLKSHILKNYLASQFPRRSQHTSPEQSWALQPIRET